MVPANANFSVYQGADFSDCIYLKNQDGTPYVFPYTHARLQLREDYDQPIVLALTEVLDDDGTGIVLTAAEGKIAINIDAATSEPLVLYGEPGTYRFDIVCSDDTENAVVDRVAQGFFFIWPELSRALLA